MLDCTESTKQPIPERQLWAAALQLLLSDAKFQAKRKFPRHPNAEVAADKGDLPSWYRRRLLLLQRQGSDALHDVVSCGPMLRRCCDMLGWDAEAVSERFRRRWLCDFDPHSRTLRHPADRLQIAQPGTLLHDELPATNQG